MASMLPSQLGNMSLLDDAMKSLSGNVIRPLACNKAWPWCWGKLKDGRHNLNDTSPSDSALALGLSTFSSGWPLQPISGH